MLESPAGRVEHAQEEDHLEVGPHGVREGVHLKKIRKIEKTKKTQKTKKAQKTEEEAEDEEDMKHAGDIKDAGGIKDDCDVKSNDGDVEFYWEKVVGDDWEADICGRPREFDSEEDVEDEEDRESKEFEAARRALNIPSRIR